MTATDDHTDLTEMNEFFPVRKAAKKVAQTRAVPMQPGETYEEAVKREDDKAERIRQHNAAKKST